MNIEEKIDRNITLAPFTTFRIGGQAKLFVQADSPEEIVEAIRWAKANNEKFFVLGGGSNLLISDNGFDGLIIKYNFQYLFRENNIIECGGGLPLARACLSAQRHSFSGLEWAVGVPGTVGGAVRGNAACFGSEMAALVTEVSAFDPETDKIYQLTKDECGFSYRSSIFKEKGIVILSCKLQLAAGDAEQIRQKIEDVVKRRSEQQPKYFSAGSVFKNVPLSEVNNPELIEEAKKENKISGAGPGGLPAAWLIEKLHFKGKEVGGARVSDLHANFIINKQGKATAEDVIVLMSLIKQKVRVEFEVQLKEEITYLN
ncbi:UDP-N-acetylmuramate dehydrogenase [Candidatus Falkowbacteria bacterium]|nr:UDP-N-acetylmuramate dehydrogenase [Candidatus Falkowbacteria bacterium]